MISAQDKKTALVTHYVEDHAWRFRQEIRWKLITVNCDGFFFISYRRYLSINYLINPT